MQPTINQLKRALQIAEEIESLQAELNSLVGSTSITKATVSSAAPAKRRGRPPADKPAKAVRAAKAGRRTMSPEARQRIIDAQKARWAKVKGEGADSATPKAGKKKAGRKAKKAGKKAAAESQE